MLPVRFLFDADSSSAAGGAFDMATLPPDIQEKLSKYDELSQFKEQTLASTSKTAEQIAQEADVDDANFRKYSVESNLMKNSDFSAYESVHARKDEDLVFEDFSKQYKEDHPEVSDEDIETQTRVAFENQYHINSQDKTLKTKGEKLLKKEAGDLRIPVESVYNKAKENYEERKAIAAKHPEYVKFFDGVVKEILPSKITIFTGKEGETEIPIEVEITEEDRKAVEEKFFKSAKTFSRYISGKPEDVKGELSSKINSFIRQRKMEEAFSQTWEKAHGIGVGKGSEVGAGQPFSLVRGNKDAGVVVEENAKKQVVDSTRRKSA